jgi:hypothetical protein
MTVEDGEPQVDAAQTDQTAIEGTDAAVVDAPRAHGLTAHAVRTWERIQQGDRDLAFPFTILGILAIVLVGLVVVPMSIPEPLPAADPAQVLGERYLVAFSASGAPTVAVKAQIPTIDNVVKTYGADGGIACTGSLAEAYELAVSTPPGGGYAFDSKTLASVKVAHQVYCPDRTAKFAKYVQRRSALNAKARAARAG